MTQCWPSKVKLLVDLTCGPGAGGGCGDVVDQGGAAHHIKQPSFLPLSPSAAQYRDAKLIFFIISLSLKLKNSRKFLKKEFAWFRRRAFMNEKREIGRLRQDDKEGEEKVWVEVPNLVLVETEAD